MSDDIILPARKENTWAMLCHLVALLGFFTSGVPLVGLIVPIGAILFVWLLKKDSDSEVNEHGRQSLNWQVTIFAVLLFTVVPVMTYQYFHGRALKQSVDILKEKVEKAAPGPEREKLTEEMDIAGKALADDLMASPAQSPPLMATVAIAFLVGVSNIVFVIWNSFRAFHGRPANYPFTVPLLATRHRRGLIRAAPKLPLD
ncbi:MAG: DUF4870 domain-containing protein [Bdellovibrionota bacterium]